MNCTSEYKTNDTWASPTRILKNTLRMNYILDEPPWWISVYKRMKAQKNKIKALQDLYGASRRDTWENLELRKRKYEQLRIKILISWTTLIEGLKTPWPTRIRIMLCLSFIKLNWWQAMDLANYLFFLKRLKKDLEHKLEEVFNKAPVRICKRMGIILMNGNTWEQKIMNRLGENLNKAPK